MAEQADRETLAAELGWMQDVAWDFFPDPDMALDDVAKFVLSSDWLADHDRRVRAEGAREALLNAADDARAVREGSLPKNPERPYDHGYANGMRLVEQRLRDRAAALGTDEEGA